MANCEGDESIYCLIPASEVPKKKPPMYKSKHNPKVPPTYSTFGVAGTSKKLANCNGEDADFDVSGSKHRAKKAASSIGATVSNTVKPENFLKKGTGVQSPPPTHAEPRKDVTEKKPGVPKRSEKPVMGLTTQKNFVVANAVDNILAPPKKPPAGEAPMVTKKDYGKPPSYLKKIRSEISRERTMVEEAQKSLHRNPLDDKMHMMTDEERKELIDSLRAKWEALNKQYQALTFSVDTVTKVQRKEALEAELEQLEKAIGKLQGKKNIFVYDDLGMGFTRLGLTGKGGSFAHNMSCSL